MLGSVIDIFAPVFFPGRLIAKFAPTIVLIAAIFCHDLHHTGLCIAKLGRCYAGEYGQLLNCPAVHGFELPASTATIIVVDPYAIDHISHVAAPYNIAVTGSGAANSTAAQADGPIYGYTGLQLQKLGCVPHDAQKAFGFFDGYGVLTRGFVWFHEWTVGNNDQFAEFHSGFFEREIHGDGLIDDDQHVLNLNRLITDERSGKGDAPRVCLDNCVVSIGIGNRAALSAFDHDVGARQWLPVGIFNDPVDLTRATRPQITGSCKEETNSYQTKKQQSVLHSTTS